MKLGTSASSLAAFQWALEHVKTLQTIEVTKIVELDTYTELLGSHVSMYHDKEGCDTYLCVYIYKDNVNTFHWQKVRNFEEMMDEGPEIVGLWLRNGEYLFTHLTKAKGQKVVNFNFL